MVEETSSVKIVIAGLNAVGKTSIIQKIFGNLPTDDLEDLPPTRGIEYTNIEFNNHQTLSVWDLGGQPIYRQSHLNKFQVIQNTTLLIYVVDVQNMDSLEVSYEYLRALVHNLQQTNTNINISVLMHKSDPQIFNNIRQSLFEIQQKFRPIKDMCDGNVFFHSTSIYSDSLEFAFSKIIKKLKLEMNIFSDYKVEPGIYLEEEIEEELETVSALEFIRNLVDIDTDFSETDDDQIQVFHQFHSSVIDIFSETVGKFQGDELIFMQLDRVMRAFLTYCTARIDQGVNSGLLTPEQVSQLALVMGQVNFMKIPFLHYLEQYDPRRLSDPRKFLESVKSILSEFPIYAFLVSGISVDEYNNVYVFFNQQDDDIFNILPTQLDKHIYSFENIDQLITFQPQVKYDALEVERLVSIADKTTKELIMMAIEGKEAEFPILLRFLDRFKYMRIEFWNIIKDQKFTEYDIQREFPKHLDSILKTLLRLSRFLEIFTVEEQNQLFQEMSNL